MNEVITFGCRLNIYESEVIKNNLNSSGLDNVIVFNTCTVTKEAQKQARKAIRKARKEKPSAKIIVTGCAAQRDPEVFARMAEIDKIIGNEEKLLPEFYNFSSPRVLVNDIMTIDKAAALPKINNFEGKSRAIVQMQNGCNHRCTFCEIPFARGNSRSVPLGAVVQQVRHLVDAGYNEVVLTGVDITAYGSDLPAPLTFAQAIKRLLSLVPDLKRLRLSSIDVAEIDEELFEIMAYASRLMPHFHISLQAGDNMILKRMKRRHNREQVIEFCHRLRAERPEVAFGADIIAGFPTENDEMFLNSLKLIKEAGLQYLHVFPYSEHDSTPASRMPQVEMSIRKERAKLLRDEGKAQMHQFFAKHLNKRLSILTEQSNIAHTENFIPVKLIKPLKTNIITNVELVGIELDQMLGRPTTSLDILRQHA